MSPTTHTPAAVFVPLWVQEDAVTVYVARALSHVADPASLDGLCLHEEPRTTGRWVCVLPGGHHEGQHG